MVQIDATDRAIIEHLQLDSRATYAEIGRAVGLSTAAVHARVKQLEGRGVVRGYGARIDPSAVGVPVTAFMAIRVANRLTGFEVRDELAGIPEIEECHGVAGAVDLLVKARCATPEHLEHLIKRVRMVPGVDRTDTTVVLTTAFEGRPYHLPTAVPAGRR